MLQWIAKFPLTYIKPSLNFVKMSYEDVPESSPTHCWNWDCEVGQLSATKCHCITNFPGQSSEFCSHKPQHSFSSQYIFICSFTVADLKEQCICSVWCFKLRKIKHKCRKHSKQPSVTMSWGEHCLFGVSFIHREIGWRLWVFTSSLHRQYTQKHGETLQWHQQWLMKDHFRNCWQVRSLIWKMLANSIGEFECAVCVCKVCTLSNTSGMCVPGIAEWSQQQP